MDMSASDLASLISVGITAATALGGGLLTLWARVEKINKQTKIELEHCKHREVVSRERRSVLLTALEFVVNALHRHDPDAPEVEQSRGLISDLKTRDQLEEAMLRQQKQDGS